VWVEASRGFTFAGMSDLVIQVKCLGIDFDKAVDTVHILTSGKVPHSSDDNPKIGIGGN